MKYLKRFIDKDLLAWKEKSDRKPLLVRGARQVGKSVSVRHFGESFKYYIEINFEKRPELRKIFEDVTDVHILTQRLSAIFSTPVVPGETLLFIDEIQTCRAAIESLWRYKEDFPQLHVVAAGSLLEFALKELPSFGVGRVSSLFIYPMSFDEFLLANDKSIWLEEKRKASPKSPLFETLHNELVQMFRSFLMVGGMPASVRKWVDTHDYLECADELDDIRQGYYDDFAKYAKNIDTQLLRNTLHSVILQIGKKFVNNRIDGGYSISEVKEALQLLADAGIIKKVNHTAANGLPLGAEVNPKFVKYIYLDTGLLLRILDLELGGASEYIMQILADAAADLVNKGSLTEMAAGWELIKYASPKAQHDLYYWENLKNGTTSEVDYILSKNMKIVPLEIKSGISGKMKSLRLFMENKKLNFAVRSSLENFGVITLHKDAPASEQSTIAIVPLYALSYLQQS